MNEKIILAIIGGFIIGMFFTWFSITLYNSSYFKISITQTRQNIISFPNGTVFKKITEASEVLNDR